jgi:MFS family permease
MDAFPPITLMQYCAPLLTHDLATLGVAPPCTVLDSLFVFILFLNYLLLILFSSILVSTVLEMNGPQVSSENPSQCSEKPLTQPVHASQDEIISYPEGGIAAWTVALGSWCCMTAGLGVVNSVGVLEAYVSTTLLADTSADSTGWIFGIYVFVSYFCGLQVGPIFDARGPRELILIGSVFLLVGTFTLGLCTGWLLTIDSNEVANMLGSRVLPIYPRLLHPERYRQLVSLHPSNGRHLPLVR